MDKIKVARMWIDCIEGEGLTLPGIAFCRFEEFNATLAVLAARAVREGTGGRVTFSVEWVDRRRLQTQLDLELKHAAGGPIAEQHIRRRLEFFCGHWRPASLSSAQYGEMLDLIGDEADLGASQILQGYQLSDGGTPAEYRNMNDARFADFIADAICGMLANVGDAPRARICSFAAAGMDGTKAGLVVHLGGAEYRVSISRGIG